MLYFTTEQTAAGTLWIITGLSKLAEILEQPLLPMISWKQPMRMALINVMPAGLLTRQWGQLHFNTKQHCYSLTYAVLLISWCKKCLCTEVRWYEVSITSLCLSNCTDIQSPTRERAAMATYRINLGLGHMGPGSQQTPMMFTAMSTNLMVSQPQNEAFPVAQKNWHTFWPKWRNLRIFTVPKQITFTVYRTAVEMQPLRNMFLTLCDIINNFKYFDVSIMCLRMTVGFTVWPWYIKYNQIPHQYWCLRKSLNKNVIMWL